MAPSAAITIYCSCKVWKLITASQVAPVELVQGQNPNSSLDSKEQIRKGFRMILMMSVCFWAICIPGLVTQMVVFNLGFTWKELDSRQYMAPAIILRSATFALSSIPGILNPLIYIFSRNDLKEACLKYYRENILFLIRLSGTVLHWTFC